jgi:hypothetical protein
MKKNILNFIATIILALILSQFLPWYSVMIAAFISAMVFSLKRSAVFFIPFLAIALLWVFHAFLLGNANDFILAKKIANLLPLNGNVALLILVTGFIGGIAAGVAAVFGKQCASLASKN